MQQSAALTSNSRLGSTTPVLVGCNREMQYAKVGRRYTLGRILLVERKKIFEFRGTTLGAPRASYGDLINPDDNSACATSAQTSSFYQRFLNHTLIEGKNLARVALVSELHRCQHFSSHVRRWRCKTHSGCRRRVVPQPKRKSFTMNNFSLKTSKFLCEKPQPENCNPRTSRVLLK